MQYHPHIHYVVPGGALSREDGKWHPSPINFFAPVKAISKVFRAKLKNELKTAGILSAVDPTVWKKPFNVNFQAVANNHHSIRYLAPYVFKVAISDTRIVKTEDRIIYFHYKKPKSHRWRTMALDAMEFIRRFLQHVLPTGFMKIRYYGFMSPGASVCLVRIRSHIELALCVDVKLPEKQTKPATKPTCPECGADLKLRCHIYFAYPLPALGYG
jgi:hypothetical protein